MTLQAGGVCMDKVPALPSTARGPVVLRASGHETPS